MNLAKAIYSITFATTISACSPPGKVSPNIDGGGSSASTNQPAPPAPPSPTPNPPSSPTPGAMSLPGPGAGQNTIPSGRLVKVASASELSAAISQAYPGDVITLSPGTYRVSGKISINRAGTASERITVRAEKLGDALIESNTVETFNINAPYWTFENLHMTGVCSNHSSCEHAFHIVGLADHTIIRYNVLRDYNAQIKGNGNINSQTGVNPYPDDVLIEHNHFYNRTGRSTSNPVTQIDVVGGRRWNLRGNIFNDFFKNGGNYVSYAAFLKGNSRDGIMERNLVVCSLNVTGGTRLGLSFGGGGSSPSYICEDLNCGIEHQNGIMRNNVIMNCNDVGIYINEGKNSKLYNNTVLSTVGVDIRFAASTADLRNNIVEGRNKDRDGGTSTQSNNLILTSASSNNTFTMPLDFNIGLKDSSSVEDKATSLGEVTEDFCGRARPASSDLGAIEYSLGGECAQELKKLVDSL